MAQGTIDDLILAATISFPSPLTLEETKQLLGYVSKNLPAHIATSTEVHDILDGVNGELLERRGTVKIGGSIKNSKNFAFDSFYTTNDYDTSLINALVFQTIPGYSLEEHRSEARELWRDVRQQVIDYWETRPS